MQVAILTSVAFTDEGRLFKLTRANAKLLADNNCTYMGGRQYRAVFEPALDTPTAPPIISETYLRFQNQLPDGQTPARVVLAGGSFLGPLPSAIEDGQFYPSAGDRIAFMERVFDGQPKHVFIALRNPASFIPKVLATLPQAERQRVLASTDLSCLSWLPMVEDIQELAPDTAITLWSDEDAPLIIGDIFRTLVGLPQQTPLINEFAFLSSLLSDEGNRELDGLLAQHTGAPPDRERMAQIFEQYAQSDAIEEEIDQPGWDDEVVAAFTELYEQDLARLQTLPGIRFLVP